MYHVSASTLLADVGIAVCEPKQGLDSLLIANHMEASGVAFAVSGHTVFE